MERLDRRLYFMKIAEAAALRSTCYRAQVGAVLVDCRSRVISIGFNGAPSGLPHCNPTECGSQTGRCNRTVHAEVNCLLQADPNAPGPFELFCTVHPCAQCLKLAVNFGVRDVYYKIAYESEPEVALREELLDYLFITQITPSDELINR